VGTSRLSFPFFGSVFGRPVAPGSEDEFRDLVFAGEFRRLAEFFASGQLRSFEKHPFTKRVMEHALLDVPTPTVDYSLTPDGETLCFSLSGQWPADERINSVFWRVSPSQVVGDAGLVERRAGNDFFSVEARIPLDPRIDVNAVFGVRSRQGVFVASPNQFAVRRPFKYEGFPIPDLPEEEPRPLKEFSLPERKSVLPLVPRALGICGLVVAIFLLIIRL